jgi:hypothetical protein
MHDWLEQARQRLTEAVGDDESLFELTDADTHELLELARIAAHASGERTNAPLVSYMVGVARGRHAERTLAQLVDDVVGKRA